MIQIGILNFINLNFIDLFIKMSKKRDFRVKRTTTTIKIIQKYTIDILIFNKWFYFSTSKEIFFLKYRVISLKMEKERLYCSSFHIIKI